MPRKSRIDAPGALHHIIASGIDRQRIFTADADRDNFLGRLESILYGNPKRLLCLGVNSQSFTFVAANRHNGHIYSVLMAFERKILIVNLSCNQRV